MAENLGIRISSSLDQSSRQINILNKEVAQLGKKLDKLKLRTTIDQKNIQTFQSNFQKQVNQKPIQLKVEYDKQLFKNFEKNIGIGKITKSAKESSKVFEELFQKQDDYSKQLFKNFEKDIGIGKTSKSAKESAQVFEELFQKTGKASIGLNKIERNTAKLNPKIKGLNENLNNSNQSLTGIIGKFSKWIAVSTIVLGAVNAIKQGIQSIVELDSALVEADKVLDLTNTQMKSLTNQAFELGTSIGRTGTEVVSATADFGRMGHSLRESLDLAEQALILTNVGDGIDNISQATSALTATLKGFNLQAEDAEHVIDLVNEISNNFAVTAGDLTEGFKRVSAVMDQSNTSIEETAALLTSATEILQNAPKAATGLNTIAQRLRGVREEGQGVDKQFRAKLQKTFKDIAGISIETSNGLKSTYDILVELSKEWGNLTERQRALITTEAAGIRQAQTFNAIMSNSEVLISGVETALDSQGSALRENEKYLESIEGKMNKFTSSVQRMWNNLISSDTIKFIVDFGTGLVNLINSGLGEFIIVVGTAIGAVAGITAAIKAFSASTVIATVATKGLTTALLNSPLFIVGAAAAVVYGVIKAVDAFTVSIKEQEERVQKLSDEYEDLVAQVTALREKSNLTEGEQKRLELLEREAELQKSLLETEEKLLATRFTQRPKRGISDAEAEAMKLSSLGILFKRYQETIRKEEQVTGNQFRKLRLKRLEQEKELKKIQIDRLELLEKIRKSFKISGDEIPESIQKAIDQFEKANLEMNKFFEVSESGTKKAKNDTEDLGLTVEELNDIFKNSNNTVDDFQSNIKGLSSVYQDLNKEEKISADTLIDLIQKYPEQYSNILKINDSKQLGIEITKLLFEIEKEKTLAKLENDRLELESELDKLGAIQAAYSGLERMGIEIPTEVILGNEQYEDILKRLKNIENLKKQIEDTELPDFTDHGGTKNRKTLNDLLKKELFFKNKIKDAENDIADLTSDELKERLKGIDAIEQANKELIEYYNSQMSAARALGEQDKLMSKIRDVEGELASLVKDRKDILNKIAQEQEKALEEQKKHQKELFDLETERLKNLEEYADEVTDKTLDGLEKEKDAVEDFYEEQEKLIEKRIDSIEDEIDAVKDHYEARKRLIDEQIHAIDKEKDVLIEKNNIEKEELERNKKLYEIEKLRERLRNIQKERNVRMLVDGEFQWVADPREVRKTQEEIKEAVADLSEWESEQAKKKEMEVLESEKEILQEKKRLLDIEQEDLIASLERKKENWEQQKELLGEFEEAQINTINETMDKIKSIEEGNYAERLDLLNAFIINYNNKISQMKRPPTLRESVGTTTPDETIVDPSVGEISIEDERKIEQLGQQYGTASTEEKEALHAEAEAIRAKYGFSGGAAGDEVIPINTAIKDNSSTRSLGSRSSARSNTRTLGSKPSIKSNANMGMLTDMMRTPTNTVSTVQNSTSNNTDNRISINKLEIKSDNPKDMFRQLSNLRVF